MGRILVDTRVPDGVELHGTELAWRLEDAHPARISKLGDESGGDGQRQLCPGQNARSHYVVGHGHGDAARRVERLQTPVEAGLADVDAHMLPPQVLRQRQP
ncbi:MAG: hypothetical protein ACLP3C_20250 [Mycobacterium sp.]|uniref:hypothetical protein n=1 Tax=Mycobacterium sp. TaxID=1785 RepID=UPI003F9CF938